MRPVLRMLETRAYARLKKHRRGWIAERIGIAVSEEESCLQILRQAGQIRLHRGRFVVCDTQTVDTRGRPDQARALQGFWLEQVAARQKDNRPGVFAYNLCSISQADLKRLVQMHQAFFADMRRVIAASQPCERVVLVATQLVGLDTARYGVRGEGAWRSEACEASGLPKDSASAKMSLGKNA